VKPQCYGIGTKGTESLFPARAALRRREDRGSGRARRSL